jgi:hypothetical protein
MEPGHLDLQLGTLTTKTQRRLQVESTYIGTQEKYACGKKVTKVRFPLAVSFLPLS